MEVNPFGRGNFCLLQSRIAGGPVVRCGGCGGAMSTLWSAAAAPVVASGRQWSPVVAPPQFPSSLCFQDVAAETVVLMARLRQNSNAHCQNYN